MPNYPFLIMGIGFWIIAKGTMSTTTFTAIASFDMILLGKNPKSFFRHIVISFFQWNKLLHNCLIRLRNPV